MGSFQRIRDRTIEQRELCGVSSGLNDRRLPFFGCGRPEHFGGHQSAPLPFAHVQREFTRRQLQLAQFMNGQEESTFRPHSLAPGTPTVGTNQSCILSLIGIIFSPMRCGDVVQMRPASRSVLGCRLVHAQKGGVAGGPNLSYRSD